ncbi:MAG TPA: cupredoxin family copper-binding protein [Caulobacteraceae bacterium]|jgi:plastocyanin
MPALKLASRLAGAALFTFIAIGVAQAQGPAGAVTIDNFSFGPSPITVQAGATVTWTNDDDIPHTVRAVDGSFHSKAMDSGDAYSFTFAKPGVYNYFCSLHPKMVGQVIVK